jgi:hypothetical protein
MKKELLMASALVSTLGAASVAQAVTATMAGSMKIAKTEIDFEGLEVAGELIKPSGSSINVRRSAPFNPLIKLRTDFNEEMNQSVNEIK